MAGWKALSDEIAAVVGAVAPAIVQVRGRPRWPSSGIALEAELVVVADHTLEDDEDIAVVLADGRELEAELVGSDPRTDLALLKVPGAGLPAASWGDGAELAAGNLVLAVGRPGELPWTTLGIVSALGGEWRTAAGGRIDRYVQLDLDPYPGFSGSALVDASGKVLGLNSTALLRGFRLALPTATIRRVAGELLKRGTIKRAYLGITGQPVRLPDRLKDTAGADRAVLISSVLSGSPAESAGFLLGDALVALDDQPIGHVAELVQVLDDLQAGSRATARIVRAGELRELPVVVGERSGE